LLRAESERGICRVICFSPRHDLTLGEMHRDDIAPVVRVWQERCTRDWATTLTLANAANFRKSRRHDGLE
jgi:galactose-1-phosphate uridylyltransferase